MSKGYIYILSNPAMPGILKIGRTMHGGRHRAGELYRSASGVPLPFHLEFEILVHDDVAAERCVHYRLDAVRVNQSREFFRCDVRDAILAVMDVAAFDYDMTVVSPEFVYDDDLLDSCARLTGVHQCVVAAAINRIPPADLAPYIKKHEEFIHLYASLIRSGKEAGDES